MDVYAVWFNLRQTARDLEFCDQLERFLGSLRKTGSIQGYRLLRRKLGFGPGELGEFMVLIETKDLAQLDAAFGAVAPRAGAVEDAHRDVWAAVTNFRSGLFRDFPDPVRQRPGPPAKQPKGASGQVRSRPRNG